MDRRESATGRMGKRISATLYTENRIRWDRSERRHICEALPDGCLYAGGRYPTKIKPEDLPEWFVYGYVLKRNGYISAKGVKHLVYKPNYVIDSHLFKDDFLYISYDEPITPREPDEIWQSAWYMGYDHLVYGRLIIDLLNAAAKYSGYDILEIRGEVEKKADWYYGRHPDEKRTAIKWTTS